MKSASVVAFAFTLLATSAIAQDKKPPADAPKAKAAQETPKATQESRKLSDKDKRGYALGVELGLDVLRQGTDLNRDLLLQGMKDALTKGKFMMTIDEMNATLADMQKEERKKMAAAIKATGDKNRKDGEAFLADNKVKEGVVTLSSGLQYKVLKAGDGKPPVDDLVVCNYRGTLIDGTEVDSSFKRNEPSTFPLKGVIRGWSEALQLMPVGSKWQLFVPSDLAYGERGDGRSIGPNSTLVFEVDLLSIKDKSTN